MDRESTARPGTRSRTRKSSPLTKATTNHPPKIPIAVSGIDYAALDRHVPFADDAALRSAADALDSAGLTPVSARPMVGHTVFTTVAIDASGAEQEQRQVLLDTQVSYRFTIDGYPLVGPGAQIQISFGAEGNVTRLMHATRTLEPGPRWRSSTPTRCASGLPARCPTTPRSTSGSSTWRRACATR